MAGAAGQGTKNRDHREQAVQSYSGFPGVGAAERYRR